MGEMENQEKEGLDQGSHVRAKLGLATGFKLILAFVLVIQWVLWLHM